MKSKSRIAELQYSPEYERMEVSLPHGTKYEDFAGMSEKLFGEDFRKRLKVPCLPCISGLSLIVREQLENVVHIDLHTMEEVRGRAGSTHL